MQKGDIRYLQEKKGIYEKVAVERIIDDVYAVVDKSFMQYQTVKVDKLIKNPPKSWLIFEEEMWKAQAALDRFKDSNKKRGGSLNGKSIRHEIA